MYLNIIIGIIYTTILNIIFSRFYEYKKILGEIFGLVLFIPIFYKLNGINLFFSLLFMSILYIISIIDIKEFIIPNKLVIILFIISIIINIYKITYMDFKYVLLDSFTGLIIGFLPFLLAIIISKGKMGAGDMKLMGAIGFCVGRKSIMLIFLTTIVFSFIFAIIMIMFNKLNLKSKLPLAPFITLATMGVMIFNEYIIIYLNKFL